MKAAKRKFNTRLIKRDYPYSVNEVAELFGIHKNAVRDWMKRGLPTIDGKRPLLVHGSELIVFLKNKQASQKRPCQPDEFYCCKCRQPRKSWECVIDIVIRTQKNLSLTGICEVCSTKIFKAASAATFPEIAKNFSIQQVHGESLLATLPTPVRCYLENLKQ